MGLEFFTKHKARLLCLVLLTIISVFFISINFIIAIVSFAILYKIIDPLLGKRVFDSLFIRGALTLFLYTILLQAVLVVSWLFNNNFSLNLTIPITLLFCIFLFVYQKRYGKKLSANSSKKISFFKIDDLIALTIALALLFVTGAIPFLTRGFDSDAGFIAAIGNNSDDASHLAYINDRIQFDRGILHQSDVVDKVRSEGQTGIYPAGWHSANAVIMESIFPDIKAGTGSLIGYALSKLAWFFLLVYFFARTAFVFYKHYTNQNKNTFSYVSFCYIGLATLFFSLYFVIDIFSQGFYSFIPQLLSTLLLSLVFIQTRNTRDIPSAVPLFALLCIGGSLSWFLTLPAFILACLAFTASLSSFKQLQNSTKLVVNGIISSFPLILLLLLSISTQYYVMSASPSGVTFIEGILLSGKIITYPVEVYYFTFIGLGLLFFYTFKNKTIAEKVLPLLLGILLFAGVMYLIQKYYTGQNMYYYYKVMYLFLIVAIPLAVASVAYTIEQLHKKNMNVALYGSALAIVLLVIFTPLSPTAVSYMRGARNIPQSSSNQVNSIIDENDNNYDDYYQSDYTIFFNPGDTEGNDISTLLVKSNKIDSACFNKLRPLLWTSTDINPIIATAQLHCTGSITIITNSKDYMKFKKQAEDSKSNISIKKILP